MRYCPLWSLFHEARAEFERQKCIEEECGMYGLCNPVSPGQEEKPEEKK